MLLPLVGVPSAAVLKKVNALGQRRAPGLDLVRRLATPGGPSADDVQQARRVAQRWVVMKDRLPGRSLAELGFTKNKISRRICYGTIDAL